MRMSLIDDATLLKMAEAEILGEAKRAAVRHKTAGVSGWQPCPKANKTFLTNTLLQTMASNRILTRKTGTKGSQAITQKRTERKLLQKNSKTDLGTNFVYMKPNKTKEKSTLTTKTNKFKDKNTRSDDRHLENMKESNDKLKIKKKLKKT